jgi:uncharacterized protein YndB with AHSA1/START domain
MAQTLEQPVVKEIFIECRPETLFPFLTDPDKMARWMGNRVLLEPKVGGRFRVDFNGKDIVVGKYLEIVPFEKVAMTWGWVGSDIFPPGTSTVQFQLFEKDNGTLLVVTHSDVPAAKQSTHGRGWDYYTGRLRTVLLGQDPGADSFAGPAIQDEGEHA